MAQLAIAAVGAAIGSATITGTVLGMSGAAIGWSVGSIIGSVFFSPTQRSSGPRLGDLKVTGAAYGEPIPWIAGHPRAAGQLWWASDRREISTTTEVGKGGGSEYTEYTYEVDLLIGLTDCEIVGVSRIWLNGKLIWSSLDDAEEATFLASVDTDQWQRLTVYTGASDQLPDSTYETAVGIGNAPAYRGRGSVFIEGLRLGTSGQLPNLTFEVVRIGTASTVPYLRDVSTYDREITSDGGITLTYQSPAKFRESTRVGGAYGNYFADGTDAHFDITGALTIEAWVYITSYGPFSSGIISNRIASGLENGYTMYISGGGLLACRFSSGNTALWGGGLNPIAASPIPLNQWVHVAAVNTGANTYLFQDGVIVGSQINSTSETIGATGGDLVIADELRGTFGQLVGYIDEVHVSDVSRYTSGFTPPAVRFTPDENTRFLWRCDARDTITPINESLQDVVEALCVRAGMPAGTYDASALASITKPVRALAIGQVTPSRTVLEQLATAYFFEAYCADKLYFIPRGGSVALTIDSDDLAAGEGQAADEALPVNITSDTEIPAQVSLSYANADADYNTATEHSDRLLSGVISTSTVSLPMAFTASEAKGICDAILLDGYASRIGGDGLSLPVKYTRLVPTDVVLVTAPDGTQYRARLVRRTDAGITCSFEWVLDDATAIVSAGITSSDYTPSLTVQLPGPTTLSLLDIPLLRDADDAPGIYAAMKPTGTLWPGAQLFASVAGGEYATVATATSRAIFGTVTVFLTDYTGGNVFDEGGSVTVDVGSGTLSSATRDAVLDSDANAMLIGDEIIQFRIATLVSAGVYKLTGLLRGRRGTEWAMTGHAVGERAVLLRTAGLVRVSYEAARIGLAADYKAVTLGKTLSSALARSITDTGIALKPFAPVNLRVDTSVAGVYTVSWDRRTRLAYRWPSVATVPLGEDTEAYVAELYNLSSVLVQTEEVTSARANFSAAVQNITLSEGLGYLFTASGSYYGIQAEGNGPRYVLEIDATGVLTDTSFTLGDSATAADENGGQFFVAGNVLSSGVPQTVLSTTIYRVDPASMATAAASYAMPTNGDVYGMHHDGTSLWLPGYVTGDLRELNGTTLASIGATALEVGIYGIDGDGTYLYITNANTGDVFQYEPGVGEGWRVTPSTSAYSALVNAGLVWVVCSGALVVLDATDGSTVATHSISVQSQFFTRPVMVFGSYVVAVQPGGDLSFYDAATGAAAFDVALPAGVTYLAGVDGTTLFTIATPSASFTDYQTWGYELEPSLAGFTVKVYQVSATVGRGYEATIIL